MPHAIFLHSALTQGRVVVKKPEQLRRLFRFEIIDVVIAMVIASSVNAAMLITSAATFFQNRDERWQPRTGLPNSSAIARSGRRDCLWGGLACFRAVLLLGRNDGWAGHHAGFPAFSYSTLDPPVGDHYPILDCHPYRSRPDPHAGHQPGGAIIRPAVCRHSAGDVHQSEKISWAYLSTGWLTTFLASLCAVFIIVLNFFLLYKTFFGR